jgi:hydrogenase maturation protease
MTVLVAGIGNVFCGDDGFGCEVVRRMAERGWASGVKLVDFGIRGFDLAYALCEGHRTAILIDAVRRGHAPGTLSVILPEQAALTAEIDTHGMHPARVFSLVEQLGGSTRGVRIVGCEPLLLDDDGHPRMGLSDAVSAAVEPAIALVEELIDRARGRVAGRQVSDA